MKKLLLSLFLIVLLGFVINAQTIVSTSPENKNVILEEFTGIHCVYCPDGHAIAQAIQNANPDDVFLINIHTGSFATPSAGEPDFRTDFGSAIAGQSGLTGYPAGTVNRHLFPGWSQGSGTAMSRGYWSAASDIVMAEGSYVNVAVEAEIDVPTRELTVHVEAYYTGNSPQSSNWLNVALLQNNTLGPQTGGGMGDNYVHMHRLVWMITGQWGLEIPTTTTGTFVDETFTYTIPADFRGVEAVIPDFEVVAFISETTQEVPSGSGCYPSFIVDSNYDAALLDVSVLETSCGAPLTPTITISNVGNDDLTSLDIDYSVNGGTVETYTWTGSIPTFGSETFDLPPISFTLESDNTLDVSLPDDENNVNNSGSASFGVAPEASHVITMSLNTAGSGAYITWNVKDNTGTVLYSGGPYSNNQNISESFHLTPECYEFNLMNSQGTGGGVVQLIDAEETVLFFSNGQYDYGASQAFSTFTSAPLIGFIPAGGAENIPVNSSILLNFNEPVRMINDDPITDPASFISLYTIPNIEQIDFTASINVDNDIITIVPDEDLPANSFINVSIAGSVIENYYDDVFESASASFETGDAVGISDEFEESVSIYPNPANDFITINGAENSSVNIYDISGKLVFNKTVLSDNELIHIERFEQGIYILTIISDIGIIRKKINILR